MHLILGRDSGKFVSKGVSTSHFQIFLPGFCLDVARPAVASFGQGGGEGEEEEAT